MNKSRDFGEPILEDPVMGTMERTAIYIPVSLDRLLTLMSAQSGEGKSKLIRNAVWRMFKDYADELERQHRAGKVLEPFGTLQAAEGQPFWPDHEADPAFMEAVFQKFFEFDGCFPPDVRLSAPRKR